ncbi:HK97-gp10 family putative phage morphogenesis protein [Staphylococcus felis]|uniref:HK97-gp10 family putative phage morphogenesis protein n=1 Tax=Staphylococcus felis TaxID=46127 RepID=UPI003966E6ED
MGAKIEKNDVEQGLIRKQMEFKASQNRVLRAGVMALIPLLKRNTPASDNKRHAKDNIAVSNIRNDRDSNEKYVIIGYAKGYSHRIHATEFGTMYQRPQLWITKTEKDGSMLVYKAMLTAMKRVMK